MAENYSIHQIEDSLKNIFTDLFNIEVNTILKESISGQKMPSLRHALLDIGQEYYGLLSKMGSLPNAKDFDTIRLECGFYTKAEIDKLVDRSKLKLIVDADVRERLGGFIAFAILRTWADDFLKNSGKEKLPRDQELNFSLLPRIKDNSDMLKGMFSEMCLRDASLKYELMAKLKDQENKSPNTIVELCQEIDPDQARKLTNQFSRAEIAAISPLSSTDSELLMVRKIWEIGVEVIVFQTTIQLDGDVILRLNPNSIKENTELLGFHNKGVSIALTYWKNLIATVVAFIDNARR